MYKVSELLAQLNENRVNIIDVGCYTGMETKKLVDTLPGKEIYSIGIDPVFHEPVYKFTQFRKVAIRNADVTEMLLYHYSDPMCNSTLKMVENITHDPTERDKKWFGGHDFERLLSTSVVPVQKLETIIVECGLADSTIHYLKIDAQGCDLEVVLSAGRYISNCLYIQMETVTSHSSELTLYEGQSIHEEEKPVMKELGFEEFAIEDYSLIGASYEADVLYRNTRYV